MKIAREFYVLAIFFLSLIIMYWVDTKFQIYHLAIAALLGALYYFGRNYFQVEEGREDPMVVWQQIAMTPVGAKIGMDNATDIGFRGVPFRFNKSAEIMFGYEDNEHNPHTVILDGRIDIRNNKTRLIMHDPHPLPRGDLTKLSVAPKVFSLDQAIGVVSRELNVDKNEILALREKQRSEEDDNGGK